MTMPNERIQTWDEIQQLWGDVQWGAPIRLVELDEPIDLTVPIVIPEQAPEIVNGVTIPPDPGPRPYLPSEYTGIADYRSGCTCHVCRHLDREVERNPGFLDEAHAALAAYREACQAWEAARVARHDALEQADPSFRCGSCGDRYRQSAMTRLRDFWLCAYCHRNYTAECDGCDQRGFNCYASRHGTGRQCHECRQYLGRCDVCGDWYDPDVSQPCRRVRDYIDSYSYKPQPLFHMLSGATFDIRHVSGTDTVVRRNSRGDKVNRTPYLGMELEMEFGDEDRIDAALVARERLQDLAYLKEDGSLSNGFELVTHPMTYAYAMAHFPWELLDDLANMGAETHDGTGLHVHVSADTFDNPAHEYRWLLFWHRNSVHMLKLARRVSHEWASFSPDDRRRAKRIAQKKVEAYETGRYVAINVNNETTREVRIFRASLTAQKVQAALALVAATVEYTRELDSHGVLTAKGWEFATFAAWVGKRPEYAPLTSEIVRLGLPVGTVKKGSK